MLQRFSEYSQAQEFLDTLHGKRAPA